MSDHKTLNLGERGDTGLKEQGKSNNKPQQKLILILAFIVISILLLSKVINLFSSDELEDEGPQDTIDVVKRESFFLEEEQNDSRKFSFGSHNDPPKADNVVETPLPPILLGAKKTEPVATPIVKASINRSGSGFMVKSGSRLSENSDTQSESPSNELTAAGAGDNDMFNAPTFKPQAAQKSLYNPHLLLSQGTVIPCSLRGKLISNIGGQVSCIVTDNVLSSSGAVVLIERGSIINGFYQGNSVQRGHNEIFVVWQEARTPNNLVIPLYSGSTDPLGANGLSGWVDNHFWERFGNAMVLSLFKDITGALSQNLTKDGKQDYTENTRNDSIDITSEIIKRSADIEPTLYKNQGDKINVFVARDIDFSNVYSLKRGFMK